jgi:hypothetical protein
MYTILYYSKFQSIRPLQNNYYLYYLYISDHEIIKENNNFMSEINRKCN